MIQPKQPRKIKRGEQQVDVDEDKSEETKGTERVAIKKI
jgi:hypothetical protein